ncbi:MAG: hypothetical protein Ct9H90mP22_8610 [Gammaproteobacteria bacterium]|nr:MAG: hypothetical protein Ct9H90mP22_8610 [Gammaproteobacteria bacterium]
MQLQSLTIEFILLQISVAFSPGLIIALVVNEAVQKGRKNALQFAYGAAAGAIGITLITAAVIAYIFSLIPKILTFIYIFGIIYIVYKGIKTIQEREVAQKLLAQHLFYQDLRLILLIQRCGFFIYLYCLCL